MIGRMGGSMRDTGRMGSSMAKAPIAMCMGSSAKESGVMASECAG